MSHGRKISTDKSTKEGPLKLKSKISEGKDSYNMLSL